MEDIEAREDGGTPQIIQTIRAALAFWVKEYISCEEIEKREQYYIKKALHKLRSTPNVEVLGNSSCKRQAILSFVVYYVTNPTSEKELNLLAETGTRRGKPLHGLFVAALLNDLFGIQARGGCSCSGPYGHQLLNITKPRAHTIRSAIQRVCIHHLQLLKNYDSCRRHFLSKFQIVNRAMLELDLGGPESVFRITWQKRISSLF